MAQRSSDKEKKVAGILMELDSEADMVNFIVLGIGIDVNMEPTSFLRMWPGLPHP